jgi:hypothetical protein
MNRTISWGALICCSLFFISCSKKVSNASSDEEFAKLLSNALKAGDDSIFDDLSHPDSTVEMDPETLKQLKLYFAFKPKKVSWKFIEMADVEMDLPGVYNGRKLKYLSAIDGVVRLDGKFDTEFGEGDVNLTLPFVRVGGKYFFPAIGYAADD